MLREKDTPRLLSKEAGEYLFNNLLHLLNNIIFLSIYFHFRREFIKLVSFKVFDLESLSEADKRKIHLSLKFNNILTCTLYYAVFLVKPVFDPVLI